MKLTLAILVATLFAGCAALDDPNLLGAALLMQQQANTMGAQPVHLTTCTPGPEGLTCWNPM